MSRQKKDTRKTLRYIIAFNDQYKIFILRSKQIALSYLLAMTVARRMIAHTLAFLPLLNHNTPTLNIFFSSRLPGKTICVLHASNSCLSASLPFCLHSTTRPTSNPVLQTINLNISAINQPAAHKMFNHLHTAIHHSSTAVKSGRFPRNHAGY